MARILVVDDEESIRGFVQRALTLEGHEVVMASDGAEALDVLAAESFDLMLSDIRMPLMDGIALALSAARDFPSMTILLMTGFADQRERTVDLEELIHDVVTKPFSLAQLRDAVTGAIASRKAA
jgi:two-component system cell cycle response regulator CpdR